MPLAISTGMGLNAYFTYNVVGYCESYILQDVFSKLLPLIQHISGQK